MPIILSKPGVYQDLGEADYHADPWPGGSLSCSGAKLLLPPGCPALYQYTRTAPRKPTDAMEFGTAAHREVLGVGWPYAVGKWDNWLTGPAKQWRKEQREAGNIPILPHQRQQILDMAAEIRRHPVASILLTADDVLPETSYFWADPETGVMLRARFDAVKLHGRVVITDFKSTIRANADDFVRQAVNLRYHWQDVTYRQAVTHTLGDADPDFLFVAQEKEPPYLVAVYRLPAVAIMSAQADLAEARRIYARCQASGNWPGLQPDEPVTTLAWPAWAR